MLDYGADRFIDHTALVARRLEVNETLIALLTAGAEWEELVVVIAALAQHRPSLALGNIVGSCISNILGAFSLGLLFRPIPEFDHSARVYSLVQLACTTAVVISLTTAGPAKMGKVGGGVLVAAFVIYIVFIAYGIYRGVVNPPEAEQSDDDDSSSEASDAAARLISDSPIEGRGHERNGTTTHRARHLGYHISQIMVGFLALSLSGYVLSHSSVTLASLLGVSESIVGLTILSFATTLPEKFVSFVSGSRGHSGILVAATAGGNIFLITLCTGVVLLGAGKDRFTDVLGEGEIGFLWASASIFAAVVWLGTTRWVGILMLAGYVTFLTLELTIWRR